MSDDATKPAAPAAPDARQPSLFQPAPAAPAPQVVHVQPSVSAQALDEIAAARKQAEAAEAARRALEKQLEELKASAAQLTEKVGLTEREKTELAAARRADAIRNAATTAAIKHGAVSETQLVKLILDELDEADGKVFAKGKPEVSADEHVAAFLKANAHLAKAKVAPGAGATGFTGTAPTGEAPKVDLSTAEGMTHYARLITYRAGETPRPAPQHPKAGGAA